MSGEALRDEGIARVIEAAPMDWKAVAFRVLMDMKGDFIGEDVRLKCGKLGVRAHHPNSWGALINHAKRAGVIEATGEWRKMRAPASHARLTQVYRRAADI